MQSPLKNQLGFLVGQYFDERRQDGMIGGASAEFFEIGAALFQGPNISRIVNHVDMADFAQQLDIFPPSWIASIDQSIRPESRQNPALPTRSADRSMSLQGIRGRIGGAE